MIVNTIAQYKCLLWLTEHFVLESLHIQIINNATLEITDKNNEQALIHWDFQDGITLREREIDNQYVLGRLPNKYIVYHKGNEDEVIAANGYVAIIKIKEFSTQKEACEQLRILTESEDINEIEDVDWSDEG